MPENSDLKHLPGYRQSWGSWTLDEQDFKVVFESIDIGQDGFATAEELQACLVGFGWQEKAAVSFAAALVKQFDYDSTGKLDFWQFKDGMRCGPNTFGGCID